MLTTTVLAPRTTIAPDTTLLGTVSLDDLNAAAGLLTRVDRKYLVPACAAQSVVDAVAGRARVLDIGGTQHFDYASTYFDTPELTSFEMSAHKRRRRFKVRTRSYLDSGLCFIEIKTCGCRGATVKERIRCSLDDADRITDEGAEFLADRLEAAGIASSHRSSRALARSLTPVMATTYQRTTLHLPDDAARATIDTDLAWTALALEADGSVSRDATVHAGDLAIIETKNPATPAPTDRRLWTDGHRPARISKYATGLALLRADLPANKWHRVLTHELSDATIASGRELRPLLTRAA